MTLNLNQGITKLLLFEFKYILINTNYIFDSGLGTEFGFVD